MPVEVWRKPDQDAYSELIWAPELHFNAGACFVYFAAVPSREIKNHLFQHRMYALRNSSANPLEGAWELMGEVDTGWDTFCLEGDWIELDCAVNRLHLGISEEELARRLTGVRTGGS